MKLALIAFLIVVSVNGSRSQSGAWEPTALSGRYIKMLYVDRLDNIYAAGEGDSVFFKSTDAGTTWQTIPSPRQNVSTNASPTMIAVSQSGEIFAANFVYGLFRSTDNGTTWSTSLTPEACTSIAIDANGRLFAGLSYTGTGRVFQSTDNGNSWTSTLLPGQPGFATLGYGFNSVGHIFARTIAGVYRSTDNGIGWMRVTTDLARGLAVFPDDAMVVCDGLQRSTDRGETWSLIHPLGIPDNENVESFAVGSQGVLYGQTREGVYQSTDLGTNWANISTGLPVDVAALAAGKNGVLYASTFQGVYRRPMNITSIPERGSQIPRFALLDQNYPNPFNPSTEIRFRVEGAGFVSLKVFDILGREVATLAHGLVSSGFHSVQFNASGLSSGVYRYVLRFGNYVQARSMLLLR